MTSRPGRRRAPARPPGRGRLLAWPYGKLRHRARLELRAAAAQFVVDAELMVRWLDQLGGEPAPAQALEERHAQVLGCARSL